MSPPAGPIPKPPLKQGLNWTRALFYLSTFKRWVAPTPAANRMARAQPLRALLWLHILYMGILMKIVTRVRYCTIICKNWLNILFRICTLIPQKQHPPFKTELNKHWCCVNWISFPQKYYWLGFQIFGFSFKEYLPIWTKLFISFAKLSFVFY